MTTTPQNADMLSLAWIRKELVRLEDSIIFALVERSGLRQNLATYERGFFQRYRAEHGEDSVVDRPGEETGEMSFLEYFLRETEKVHARLRRYTSPDEYPFFEGLPAPVIRPVEFATVLVPNAVNYNAELLRQYVTRIVPAVCATGDDGHYGSSAMLDISILQLLSRRIHFGKLVAESKFRAQQAKYSELIARNDQAAVLELLTDRAVERTILDRLRMKASIFGQEIDVETTNTISNDSNVDVNSNAMPAATEPSEVRLASQPTTTSAPVLRTVVRSTRIDRDKVAAIYAEVVIDLTKRVEVDYLMARLA